MKLVKKPLSDLALIIAGQSPLSQFYNKNGEGLPFYQGKTDFGDKHPKARNWCTGDSHKEASGNDILLSVRAPVGPVNICQNRSIIGRGLSAIRAKENVSFEYLYYYLKANEHKIEKLGTGSTFKAITQSQINKIVIPIPKDYDDQIRIAAVLTRAEKLIAKRKESIKALDELLKSTFLEMFGDPVRNEKGWEELCIDKNIVTDINSGTSFGGEENKLLDDDELGVLKISAVTQGVFNPNEYKAVKKDVINKKVITLKKGMFLFSRANTKELVAACCIVNQDYPNLFLPDKLWVLTINDICANSIYLNYLLKNENYRNLLREKATGGHDSMLNISMQKFRTLMVPVPPPLLQNQFAMIVEKVETIKVKYNQSLVELENLYGALSQRAFKGELDLSGVEIDEIPTNQEVQTSDNVNIEQNVEKPVTKEEQKSEISFLDALMVGCLGVIAGIGIAKLTKDMFREPKSMLTRESLIKILKDQKVTAFTFSELWQELTMKIDPEALSYEKIKDWIYGLLEEENPVLMQKFDEDRNEIVFKVNI